GQRLTLASLPEGDDVGVLAAQVVIGKAGQFFRGGCVAHARLRGGHVLGLQRDAAEAVGVAGGRGRERRFVAAVEGVLRRVAVVLEGTDAELLDDAVARQRTPRRLHRGGEVGTAEARRL